MVDKEERLPIRALIATSGTRRRVAPVIECSENAYLADMLNEFQEGQSHLAIVYDDVSKEDRKFLGILTIEDVFEFIIQEVSFSFHFISSYALAINKSIAIAGNCR